MIRFSGAALLIAASALQAQSLESRVAAARGSVAFDYATRKNVCGDGSSININDDTGNWTILAQSRDDRALALFERLLTAR